MVSVTRRLAAVMACALAVALVGAVVLASPTHAQAASKKKVWVVSSAQVDDYVTSKYKFTYSKGLLTKEKASAGDVLNTYWKYDKKGNYKKQYCKHVTASGEKSSWKYVLKFDSKKRVKSYAEDQYADNPYKLKYNSKGRCKKYGFWKVKTNSKGWVTKLSESGQTEKFTRDSKGNFTRIKTSGYDNSITRIRNTYKSGRLASWIDDSESTVEGKLTWKKISVPKKYVKKVKAQQRWIVDHLQSTSDPLPLVAINK